jgi:hypothetical protein
VSVDVVHVYVEQQAGSPDSPILTGGLPDAMPAIGLLCIPSTKPSDRSWTLNSSSSSSSGVSH